MEGTRFWVPPPNDSKGGIVSSHPPASHRNRLVSVIPTGAQRSGGTCGPTVLSWKCFSTEEAWARGPTKGDENSLYSATIVPGSTTLPFVISTGAQRSGEICGSTVLSWKCFSPEESRARGPTQG